jgi:Polysaccharide deacetylase
MICLTFDTDYMSQEDLKKFMDVYSLPGKVTFFAHEDFPFLTATNHEVGPHPFITDLSTWEATTERIAKDLQYKPRGIRTHSCVFSHMIGIGLGKLGYTYISQDQHLFQAGLKPFRHPWGIWELPIYYMDNMDFYTSKNWSAIGHVPFNRDVITAAVAHEGLYVFDFHPLHILLNTPDHAYYSSVRDRVVGKRVSPFDLRFEGRGVGEFFMELCDAMTENGERSYTCMEALRLSDCVSTEDPAG